MGSWLIYALGGGFGHLTRAAALAQAARHQRVRILTNSPYAACVQRAVPELDLIALPTGMPVPCVKNEVADAIQSAALDCLIVDTFPRGIVGELVDVVAAYRACKILVQRDLKREYRAAFDLDTFIRNSYDLAVVPGDAAYDGPEAVPQTVATAPWIVRSWDELFTRERARAVLGLRGERPCALICAAGNADELDWYGAAAAGLRDRAAGCDVRCIAPSCPGRCPPASWMSYWPAVELFAAADVVIGGAGYNTVYECAACGVPLIARPWPRKYDRQEWRARRGAGRVTIVQEPGEAVCAAMELLQAPVCAGRIPQFHNGATDAVALIDRMVTASKLRQ